MVEPKVFISYSWSSEKHCGRVKYWAERLLSDGIDVVADFYELKEGYDIYAFMERIVSDLSITHVLVMCDKKYADKADARNSGVGVEAQIISSEVYKSAVEAKFIPIVCEFDEEGNPALPVFMKSKMWINFSDLEEENKNWEKLVRLLYGKPLYIKPGKGKAPVYITNEVPEPTREIAVKFNILKQAIYQKNTNIKSLRRGFIESCMGYADRLRVRKNLDKVYAGEKEEKIKVLMGEKIIQDCRNLKAIRDHLCDWILLEGDITEPENLSETVIDVLERLMELKSRPREMEYWNDSWGEAHSVFVYEAFLYIIATLLKVGAYKVLHEIYSCNYFMPSMCRDKQQISKKFDCFYGYSVTLQAVLSKQGERLYYPAAELLKQQADREDIPFDEIIQAELLTFLMSYITPEMRWEPQTLRYSTSTTDYLFFKRCVQHKYFKNLSIITGVESADVLREAVKRGHWQASGGQSSDLHYNSNIFDYNLSCHGFWIDMNMDELDKFQ